MFIDQTIGDIQTGFSELTAMLDQMPIGIVVAEAPSGKLLFLNRLAADLLEHPVSAAAANSRQGSHYRALHADGRRYALGEYPLARALKGETVCTEEILYERSDGNTGRLRVTALPMGNASGQPARAIETLIDISPEWQARQAGHRARLSDAETRLRLATEVAGFGFWEWDSGANAVHFSPQWKHLLGYRDDELPHRHQDWEARLHPDDRAHARAELETCLRQGGSECRAEFRLRHRDGSYRWFEVRAQILRDDDARPLRMLGTHLDISGHKEHEEQVRLSAQHDRLTGLPNRALTFELAEQSLSAARRTGKMCALLFIDLDGFKPINDSYGHHIGDAVLKKVGARLKSAFRAQDTIGRIGGDEFLVVATQLDTAPGAAHAAAHALQQLSLPYHIGELVLHSSPSIGISLFPRDGADVETLVRQADAAMYDVKQHGKAGYRFFSAPDAAPAEVRQLQQRLRESLAQHHLQLHYQPMVDLHTRRVVAAEALLRWPAPPGVALTPDMLVLLAEQSGLLDELSGWVLQQACLQHGAWRRQGLPAIDICINLSPVQLREAELPRAIRQQLDQCAIDPAHLWIEISDRALNGGTQYAIAALERVKALGVRLALDDFGVGRSTLEQLGRLPFERVKIDHSLIMALPHDKTSAAVTEAAISFGHALGIEVIAEGLESQQVLDFLLQHHCHLVQGFYMARPMPGPQFAQWYRGAGLH